jgi:hypothetical protein
VIYIKDDFLSEPTYKGLMTYLNSNEFKEVDTGDKSFWIQESNQAFNDIVTFELEAIENKPIRPLLQFFRVSNDKVDTDWRIHADTIINNEKPDRALVLYLSKSEVNELHGTAFWEHNDMGEKMPSNISDDEFDLILKKDSNNLDKWKLKSVVGYKPNRLISYPANYFHSKYPNISWEKGRVVYVMFYKNE